MPLSAFTHIAPLSAFVFITLFLSFLLFVFPSFGFVVAFLYFCICGYFKIFIGCHFASKVFLSVTCGPCRVFYSGVYTFSWNNTNHFFKILFYSKHMFIHNRSVFTTVQSEFYLSMFNITVFLSTWFNEIQEIILNYVSVSKL